MTTIVTEQRLTFKSEKSITQDPVKSMSNKKKLQTILLHRSVTYFKYTLDDKPTFLQPSIHICYLFHDF